MLGSSHPGNPHVRIPAVTLSELAFGVNGPDGSPDGLAAIRSEQLNLLRDGRFFHWACGRPNDTLVLRLKCRHHICCAGDVSRWRVPTAEGASERNGIGDDDQGIEMLESDREKSHRWIAMVGVYQGRA
jgi:hypothetical protein